MKNIEVWIDDYINFIKENPDLWIDIMYDVVHGHCDSCPMRYTCEIEDGCYYEDFVRWGEKEIDT